MNVLIIGGNGFIGSHLVDHLLSQGHHIRVFDYSHEKFRNPLDKVDYRIASLDNFPELYEAFLDIDMVFHLAHASVPSTSNIDIIADVNKNLISTLNVLNLVIKFNIKKLVYFSSGGAVYGNTKIFPIAENHPLKPISSYGILKMTIEQYIGLYKKLHNLDALIIRPSNPYGSRQGHYLAQGVITTFLRRTLVNESITIYGDGSATKDYIYIEDLIKATYLLSFSKATGIFNIGSGVGTELNTIISIIQSITGKTITKEYVEDQSYDVHKFILDISKVKKHIDWDPKTSLNKGINSMWEWLKSKNNKS